MAYGGTMSRLASLAMPTLIVHGSQDRLVNPANADILAGAVAHAQVVILDGASHVFFTDQPERTASVFVDFLSSQPAAA